MGNVSRAIVPLIRTLRKILHVECYVLGTKIVVIMRGMSQSVNLSVISTEVQFFQSRPKAVKVFLNKGCHLCIMPFPTPRFLCISKENIFLLCNYCIANQGKRKSLQFPRLRVQ